MRMLRPMLCTAVVGVAAALSHAPAAALPMPASEEARAGGGMIYGAASSRHYRGRVGQRRPQYRHRHANPRRHGNQAGAAFAGAALGLLGGALAAGAAPSYEYYDGPTYDAYPVYAPVPHYGYYSGPAYPAYGYGHGAGYSGQYYGRHGGGASYSDPRLLSGQPGSLNQP